MRAESASGPDWRDAAAYAPLLEADRSLFAWEWLRRDPSYRSAALCAASAAAPHASARDAASFGLVAFEPAQLAVPHARPLWRGDAYAYVLRARAIATGVPDDELDLEALKALAHIVADRDGEHLLLSDGWRALRVDAPPEAFAGGPVVLRYSLEGLASAEAPLLALRRLVALCRTGGFARSLHRPEQRARRWILMLRAFDALADGADQRAIAAALFSRSAEAPRWRSRESSARSQVQRLVRSARAMSHGGYRRLLAAH